MLNLNRITAMVSLAVMALLSGASYTAGGQSGSVPFTITIRGDGNPHKVGSDIYLSITQNNISGQAISCASFDVNSTNLTYKYEVRDQNGNEVKQRANAWAYPGHARDCFLQPGEKISGKYLISWLCDLSKPGDYSVQVSRNISEDASVGAVKSNVIHIVVNP